MADLHLNIISPEKTLYDGDIERVTLPGTVGPFTIYPHHAPIISSLEKGCIEYIPADESDAGAIGTNANADAASGGSSASNDVSVRIKSLEIKGGFIEMSDGVVTVCVS